MAQILLQSTIFLPLIAALALGESRRAARKWALGTTLAVLAAAVILIARFDPAGPGVFASTDIAWLGPDSPLDVRFSIALDGLSLWLFGLTALLAVVAVLVSWEAIRAAAPMYYRLLLVMEAGMIGVFVARDVLLFYVFFELTLIPLFFLIGIWGGRRRAYAAIKFFLFTLSGSLLTLLGLLAIVLCDSRHSPDGTMTLSIAELTQNLALPGRGIDPAMQIAIFVALFAGFAVKVPFFPLHTWLPLAQTQAPAAVGVLLAGVLLKIGAYGFLRFSLPMLPQATAACMPYLLWLCLAGVFYGGFVALAQTELKRLIAYCSVSQMGLCMLGIFALNRLALQGGLLLLVSHGLSIGGLLALVGMLSERQNTHPIDDLGGLARTMPRMSFFMLVMVFSTIALPALSGFAGQLLLLTGTFQRGWTGAPPGWALPYRAIAVLAPVGMVLGAWAMWSPIQRLLFGHVSRPQRKPDGTAVNDAAVNDLNARETLALTPLVVLILWIGLQPQWFLDRTAPTLQRLTVRAVQAADGNLPIERGLARVD